MNDGVWGIIRSNDIAVERGKVLEGVRERGFELWNDFGIENGWAWNDFGIERFCDACDVKNARKSVAYNPQLERHVGILVAIENQDGGNKGKVPENVQDDEGLGKGLITLPLFELLRCRLPHHHGRLCLSFLAFIVLKLKKK